MKPPRFDYFAPGTLEEALDLIGRHSETGKLLAGGQSLVPLLNLRLARPEQLIDLNAVPGLAYIRRQDGGLAVGAMTRQRAVERSDEVRRICPLLSEAVPFAGHPQIRNRGTVGGILAHADPAAELAAVWLVLGGRLTVRSGSRGDRTVAAGDYFRSYFATAVEPSEIVTEVWFPALPERTGWGFQEVARRHGDFALVGVAALLSLDGSKIREARLAVFGVGGAPVRAVRAERLLVGVDADEGAFARAGDAVQEEIEPQSDVHASADYRRHVAGVLTNRALTESLARARRTP